MIQFHAFKIHRIILNSVLYLFIFCMLGYLRPALLYGDSKDNKRGAKTQQWFEKPMRIAALQCNFENGKTLEVIDKWINM